MLILFALPRATFQDCIRVVDYREDPTKIALFPPDILRLSTKCPKVDHLEKSSERGIMLGRITS